MDLKLFGNHGLCWTLEKEKVLFVHITKNASTSIRFQFNFEKNNFITMTEENRKKYKKFMLIRNPIERFASGFSEAKTRKESNAIFKKKLSKEVVKEVIEKLKHDLYFEEHLIPQYEFLRLNKNTNEIIELDKILLFENINLELPALYEEFGLGKINKINHKQITVNKGQVLSVLNDNENLKDEIKLIYNKDFEIYNKLKYEKK